MKYQTVFSVKEFTDENGDTKRRNYPVGNIKTTDNGAQFLNLYAQPAVDFRIADEQ